MTIHIFPCSLQGVWLICWYELWITIRNLQRLFWRSQHGISTRYGPIWGPWRALGLTEQSHRLHVTDLLWNSARKSKNKRQKILQKKYNVKKRTHHVLMMSFFSCFHKDKFEKTVTSNGLVTKHTYSVTAVTEVSLVFIERNDNIFC